MSINNSSLKLLNPSFESPLINAVMELEHLRRLSLVGTTPPHIFFQLKDIFHFLESLGSARIEGNRTTISDYVDAKLKNKTNKQERFQEIENIESALIFVEKSATTEKITHNFIRDLHSLVVKDLTPGPEGEGDRTPGKYRDKQVKIVQSEHVPPEAILIHALMDELLEYLNRKDDPKYDLIKIAIAHHRFCWIHPFNNGNGRVVRLLTYALLIKFGFQMQLKQGRLLNPTAVFCNDRNKYYEMLSIADQGDDNSLEQWCTYVLGGLRTELEKLDHLLNYEYLKKEILSPAINICHERSVISNEEKVILENMLGMQMATLKSKDILTVFPDKNPRQRNYMIQKLTERKILQKLNAKSRSYTISFVNNKLLYNVVDQLIKKGFAPNLDNVGNSTSQKKQN